MPLRNGQPQSLDGVGRQAVQRAGYHAVRLPRYALRVVGRLQAVVGALVVLALYWPCTGSSCWSVTRGGWTGGWSV